MWRLWTAEAATPKFLLVNESGQLLVDESNHSIEGSLSGAVVSSIQMTAPGAGTIMSAGWGQQVVTMAATSSGMRIDGSDFAYTAMTAWRQVCSEFEVFTTSYGRPTGSGVSQVLVKFGVAVGIDGEREFSVGSGDFGKLHVYTALTELPDDPYDCVVWVDWMSDDQSEPFNIGDVVVCNYYEPQGGSIPSGAIYSFGSLIDY